MTDQTSERQLIRDIMAEVGVGMLTTVDERGRFVSRPMRVLLRENDPAFYFLSDAESNKMREIRMCADVGLTFAGTHRYLSLLGRADLVDDADLRRELWSPDYRAWFPEGVDDSNVGILRVRIDRADYWDAPASRVVRLIQAVEATITGKPHGTPRTTIENP